MKINYQSLEKKIDLNFKNKDLLIQALTHKSFNPNENNEKIEFLVSCKNVVIQKRNCSYIMDRFYIYNWCFGWSPGYINFYIGT